MLLHEQLEAERLGTLRLARGGGGGGGGGGGARAAEERGRIADLCEQERGAVEEHGDGGRCAAIRRLLPGDSILVFPFVDRNAAPAQFEVLVRLEHRPACGLVGRLEGAIEDRLGLRTERLKVRRHVRLDRARRRVRDEPPVLGAVPVEDSKDEVVLIDAQREPGVLVLGVGWLGAAWMGVRHVRGRQVGLARRRLRLKVERMWLELRRWGRCKLLRNGDPRRRGRGWRRRLVRGAVELAVGLEAL